MIQTCVDVVCRLQSARMLLMQVFAALHRHLVTWFAYNTYELPKVHDTVLMSII